MSDEEPEREGEFESFEALTRRLLKVPKAELKEKLEEHGDGEPSSPNPVSR